MTTIQELKAVVSADTSGYDQGMERVGRGADDVATKTDRASRATDQFGRSASTAKDVLGAFGVALTLDAMVDFGRQSIDAANSLERTEAVVRSIAGSQERYNEVLALAQAGQDKYGGSLQNQLEGLRGLVPLANRYGLELEQLDNVSRRLAVSSPEQGIQGASFAIKEFLASGDTVSLVERFELSRGELNKLKEAAGGDLQARLDGLSQIMTDLGYTNQTLADATETTANTYDRLGGAASDAEVALGKVLATSFEPWAKDAIKWLGDVAHGLEEFSKIDVQQNDINSRLIKAAEDYEQYAERVKAVNQRIAEENKSDPLTALFLKVPELTEEQFNLARSMEAQGKTYAEAATQARQYGSTLASMTEYQRTFVQELVDQGKTLEEAVGKAQPLADQLTNIAAVQRDLEMSGRASAETADDLANRLTNLVQVQGPIGASANAVAEAYRQNRTDAEGLTKAIEQLEGAQKAQQREAERNAYANRVSFQVIQEEAPKAAVDMDKLGATLEQVAERGAAAQERLADVQERYSDQTTQKRQEFARKIEDIQQSSAATLASLEENFSDRRASTLEQEANRVADLARDGSAKLLSAEQDYQQQSEAAQRDHAERVAELAGRRAELERDYARQSADAQRDYAGTIAEIDQRLAESRVQEAERSAERMADIQEKTLDGQRDLQSKLLEEQRSYQQSIEELQSRGADSQADRAQDYQDKIADAEAKAANDRADRAANHQRRLADLRGQLVDLDPETDKDGRQRNRIQQQIAQEEEAYRLREQQSRRDEELARSIADREFQQAQEREAREEQQQVEKINRDRERAEAAALAKAEQLTRELEQQRTIEEADAAERASRLDARAEQDRAKAAESFAQKQAEHQQDLAEKQAALDADIQAEQNAYARKSAERQSAYAQERAETIAQYAEKQAEAEAQADKELLSLETKYAREREQASQAAAQKLEATRESFAREQQERAEDYAEQQEELKQALGDQLTAYTNTQLEMTAITIEEAAKRRAIIAEQFGTSGDTSGAFGDLASGIATQDPRAALGWFNTATGVLGGLGINVPGQGLMQSIGQVNIHVSGIEDPADFAIRVRDELLILARQNGSAGIP